MHIVQVLRDAGHVAYLAGGCVRDMLLGREAKDYDVATDAAPPQVLKLFRRSQLVGEAFGVVLVIVDRAAVEVATFRTEWGYADGRHPDHVEFSDAEHDAKRRDFTINGLFYDPLERQVLDYVGGQADLERRVIRAIGQPEQRFGEDYLRMLRAVRFAAGLGFAIDPATSEAMRHHGPELARISRERIGMEVKMMLEHASRAEAARLMQGHHLDVPVLQEPTSEREPICLNALNDSSGVRYATALAAWALDRHVEPHVGDDAASLRQSLRRLKAVQITRGWRKALVLSNEHRDELAALLKTLPDALRWDELSTAARKRLLARSDWDQIELLMRAADSLHTGERRDWPAFERQAAELRAEGVAPDPLVTGDDLVAAGFTPGPMFKRILEAVYDAQLAGEVTTQPQALALARQLAE